MVRTMDLLFLFFVIATAWAKFPEILESDSELEAALKSVHQTWDPKKEITIDDDAWSNAETAGRKRGSKAASGYCEAGYTGENCEFPICKNTNAEALSHPTGGPASMPIDIGQFDSCNISMLTVFDTSLRDVVISVTTNPTAFPDVHLIDSAGNEIQSIVHENQRWIYAAQNPGLYTIRIEAPQLSCFINVAGTTTLQVAGGFVRNANNVASDRMDVPNDMAYYMEPSTFIVHAYGLSRPGQIVSVTMFEMYNTVARPQTLLKRYGCAYEYFVETFFCRSTQSTYYYRVDGIDFSGNRFRRLGTFSCIVAPTTAPIVTTTPDPGPQGCRNGGFLMKNDDGTTYCYCQGYFTGRDCGSNMCLNGGTRTNGLVCLCPTGFSGNHCERVQCIDRPGAGFGTDSPIILFAVHAQSGLRSVIQQIATQIRAVANALNKDDTGYIQHFGLILFSRNKLTAGYTDVYTDIDDLINALTSATLEDRMSCEDIVLTAIAEIISEVSLKNRSPVYVITDAVPNDEDQAETIFHINSYRMSPIYVIYVQPSVDSGCTMDVYHTGYQAMVEVTKRTSGQVFVLPNNQTGRAGELFFAHALHTLHRSSLISSVDSANCGNRPKFVPIRIDRSLQTLTITATGRDTYLSIQTDGSVVPPLSVANYTIGDIKFWWYDNLTPGVWGFSITSFNANAGACSARIYSIRSSSQQRTEYDLFWGYTNFIQRDMPFVQPIVDEPFALVAHVNNYNVFDPSKVFAELIVSKELGNGRQEQVYLSNGLWRDECDYQLYFPPMSCHNPNEILYFSVYIRDELGYVFQRSGVSYCSIEQPTLTPPTDCINGGAPINLPNNTFVCYCTADFTGNRCEIRVCHNGGTPSQSGGGSECACPSGYFGMSCQNSVCNDGASGANLTPLHRDMAFVVELTFNSASAVNDLAMYIGAIVREIRLHHPEWISNYFLVGYNSTWYGTLGVYRSNQVDQFIAKVKEMYQNLNTPTADTGCQVLVWEALQEITDYVRNDAYVNLFHASGQKYASLPHFATATMIFDKRIVMNSFYAIGSNNQWLCNATFTEYARINALCEANGGRAYPVQLGDFHQIFRIIPSYHMSSLVYVRKFSDCTTAQQTVYFPVDSYTQSIQLNIRGYKSQTTVYRSDGKTPNATDAYDLYDASAVTGWRITEVRQACDPNWTIMGNNYCVLFYTSTDAKSWSAAAQQCHSAGGSLIDVNIQDNSVWIDNNIGAAKYALWIGLNRINGTNATDFYWDTPSNIPPIKLTANDWKNWAANEPSTDLTKQCVQRKQDGTWAVISCDTVSAYICQKHKYDPDFEPTLYTDDNIPNGKWWVTIKTEAPPQGWYWNYTGCMVEVHVQSSIVLFTSYSQQEHSNVADAEPITGSKKNHFAASIFNGGTGSILSYAHIYDIDTLQMQTSTTYQRRIGCTYPWLSQTWSCDTPNTQFAVIHIGEDQNGANFQRMTTGLCPLQVVNCNHGVSVGGVCVCEDYWQGDRCNTPMCIAGQGLFNATTNICYCNNGYTGTSCQYSQCLPQVPHTFSLEQITFALVLEMTIPNKANVQKLADGFAAMVQAVQNAHPTWFNRFLAVYIDSSNYIAIFSSGDVATFVNHIKGQIAAIKDTGATCGAPLFGGMTAALSSANLVPGSPVFMVTRSTANDMQINMDGFLTALTVKKAQLNYLVVDDSETICGLSADNDAVKNLSRLVIATGGNFFIVPSARYMTFLSTYLIMLHSTTLLVTPTITDMTCNNTQWFAQVDYKMDFLYITMFAPAGTITIINPNNEEEVDIDMLYVRDKTTFVRLNTEQKPGMYTVRVSAGSPCSVQIRGSTPVNVWAGFTQPPLGGDGSHMDNVTADPVQPLANNINLHVSNLDIGRLTYTELLNPYDGSIAVASLYRRQNCSYEYYSDPFTCPDSDFMIMVNGIDDYGQNFRREVGIAHCYNSTAPAMF